MSIIYFLASLLLFIMSAGLYDMYESIGGEEPTYDGEEPCSWEKGKPRILTVEEEQYLAELAEFEGQDIADFWRRLAEETPRSLWRGSLRKMVEEDRAWEHIADILGNEQAAFWKSLSWELPPGIWRERLREALMNIPPKEPGEFAERDKKRFGMGSFETEMLDKWLKSKGRAKKP